MSEKPVTTTEKVRAEYGGIKPEVLHEIRHGKRREGKATMTTADVGASVGMPQRTDVLPSAEAVVPQAPKVAPPPPPKPAAPKPPKAR